MTSRRRAGSETSHGTGPSGGEAPIRVMLADDHALMRRALRQLLDHEDDVEVISEAADIATLNGQHRYEEIQVMVLDLDMAGSPTIDAIRGLAALAPRTAMVVLSMHDNPAFAKHVLDAGALAYVSKEYADTELPRAVRLAALGHRYLSPGIAAKLEDLAPALTEDELTPRELEVLRLIAHGFTTAEIAEKLALSTRTVETHRARILRKLGVRTRAQLVQYALQHGLLNTSNGR